MNCLYCPYIVNTVNIGIVLEKVQDQPLDAYECYSNVWSMVRNYSGERGDTMTWWLEEALYRRPLLQMVYG
jgi:hypothetical protein